MTRPKPRSEEIEVSTATVPETTACAVCRTPLDRDRITRAAIEALRAERLQTQSLVEDRDSTLRRLEQTWLELETSRRHKDEAAVIDFSRRVESQEERVGTLNELLADYTDPTEGDTCAGCGVALRDGYADLDAITAEQRRRAEVSGRLSALEHELVGARARVEHQQRLAVHFEQQSRATPNERAIVAGYRDDAEHTAIRVGDIEAEIARTRGQLDPIPASRGNVRAWVGQGRKQPAARAETR